MKFKKIGINFQCYHYYLVDSFLRCFFDITKVFQNNEGKKLQAHSCIINTYHDG